MKFIIIIALAIFITKPVNAIENCDDPQTQLDMNLCSFKDYQDADLELNRIYKKALEHINSDHEEDFRENQRIWIDPRRKSRQSASPGRSRAR